MIRIPVLDIPTDAESAVVSALAELDRLADLMAQARRSYTPMGLRGADARSRIWSSRCCSPCADAVRAVADTIGRPGMFLLNYSYEWGCTAGVAEDADLGGTTLLRTLDWPFDGLGRNLIVIRQPTAAGPYLSVTWPGFAGVLTGLAPGRFAASINQPPMALPGLGKALGWIAARIRVNGSTALPPTHLLRLAFDTCRSFAEAVALLRSTPLCMPAIFTVAGPAPGEAIVIERTLTAAFEPDMPAAANHWAAEPGPAGRPRNPSSAPRRDAMCGLIAKSHPWSLDWVRAPILQPDTRLAIVANPKTGRLLVQGWEATGPATMVLDLSAEL